MAETGEQRNRPTRRNASFDRIDIAILEALKENARITYQALSERVGLSPRPCLERVRKLEKSGVILRYSALVDPNVVGHHVVALAEIAMRDPSSSTRQRLERSLIAHPAVAELQIVNGEYDYIARIVAPSLADYEALTEAYVADPAFGIGRIHTTFAMKTLKPFTGYPPPYSE